MKNNDTIIFITTLIITLLALSFSIYSFVKTYKDDRIGNQGPTGDQGSGGEQGDKGFKGPVGLNTPSLGIGNNGIIYFSSLSESYPFRSMRYLPPFIGFQMQYLPTFFDGKYYVLQSFSYNSQGRTSDLYPTTGSSNVSLVLTGDTATYYTCTTGVPTWLSLRIIT